MRPPDVSFTAFLRRDGGIAVILALGLFGGVGTAYYGDSVWPLTAALGGALLYLAVYDIRHFLLPDAVTIPLLVAGLLNALWQAPGLVERAVGGLAGFGIIAGLALVYRRFRGREGIGLGDAKLLAAGGAWLGWPALPVILLIASATALVTARTICLWRRVSPSRLVMPFGPFLALAIFLLWLFPI